VLTENGIAVKPETVMSGSRAKRSDALSAPYKMSSTPPADMLIDGLIVRFAAEDAKARARANQTPPDGLLAQFYAVANTPMIFQRAMSMDAFVFRFMTPLKWEDTHQLIERLRQMPEIERVEPDARVKLNLTPNDPYFFDQWPLAPSDVYLGGINAEAAWDITTGSNSTVVAVIDTGITSPASFGNGRVLSGYDFISDTFTANDGNGRDADASDPGDWTNAGECGATDFEPSSWHGTHVAGTIASPGNNSSGIAGVNWNTRILPVRVLGKCGGTHADIVDGMSWAAGLAVPGVPNNPNPARILNLSLGGPAPNGCADSIYQETINKILGMNVLIVVAAGNNDDEAASYIPASCDGVVTVGAVDHLGYRSSYSNFSFEYRVALSAPGGDISYYGDESYGVLSAYNDGTTTPGQLSFKALQGTSMAAPHVAGVASLAIAIDPEQRAQMIGYLMALTSHAFAEDSECTANWPLCGDGILDAEGTLLGVDALKPYWLGYNFYNPDLNHYFMVGTGEEVDFVLSGVPGRWWDMEDYFLAWRDGSQGALPVCRFYGTPGVGPNSHFYTVDPGECEMIKNAQGWTYEGIAFYMKKPSNGTCPSNTTPIHRYYNNRWMHNDSNHRYASHLFDIDYMIQQGWTYEGVAMCAGG
jgi:serine protease